MNNNHTLLAAREEQNGEFFILRNEVEKEMVNYISHLVDKKVYVPNTKYTTQYAMYDAFVRYFGSRSALEKYGIKEFSYSYYDEEDNFVLVSVSAKGILKKVVDASDDESRLFYVHKQIDNVDVVICNPEGSKFRSLFNYIKMLKKDYILCTSVLSITYKSVFDSFVNGRVKFGMTIPTTFYSAKENKNKKFGNRIWITSFDNGYSPKFVDTWYDMNSFNYKKFDNYNVINVDCIKMIPMDCDCVMALPITFVPMINTNQFEILDANDYIIDGSASRKSHGLIKDIDGSIEGKIVAPRILIRFRNI